jgi:hypothetical protein
MWRPSIDALSGERGYPMFRALVGKMEVALDVPGDGSRGDDPSSSTPP